MSEKLPPVAVDSYELLIRANILSPEELEDSLKLSDRMRMPLGRMLEMNGYCKETHLPLVDNVTELVADRHLTLDAGVKAVEYLVRQNLSLEIALNLVQTFNPVKSEKPRKKNKLGDLLRVTGIITKHQLELAQSKCINTNLPLGVLLVDLGVISKHVYSCAIHILGFLHDNVIDYDLATHALKRASIRNLTAETALTELTGHEDFELSASQINQLLMQAGLISPNQLLTALEVQLVEGIPIAEVFIDFGYVSELCLHSALHLTSMLLDGQVSEEQCCVIIRRMKLAVTDEDVNNILSALDGPEDLEEEVKTFEVSDVLLASGLVSKKTLAEVKPRALNARKSILRTLVDEELLDEQTAALVNETKDFLESRVIIMPQANIALAYSLEHNVSFAESVRLFGWSLAVA